MRFGSKIGVLAILAACASVQAATQVQLNMSSAFNYDAYASKAEYDWSVNQQLNSNLNATIGDHYVAYTSAARVGAYINEKTRTDAGVGGVALPTSGQITAAGYTYQLATNHDNNQAGTYVKANNALSFGGNNVRTALFNLPEAQRGKYEAINFVFVANRANASGTFEARVRAIYSDTTSEVIWTSGVHSSAGANSPGGSFGSASVGLNGPTGAGAGGYNNSTDANTAFTNAFASTASYANPSSGQYLFRLTGANMWTFSAPLALDEAKTLTSIEFYTSSGSRSQSTWIFAATATAVPEPTTLGAAGLVSLLGLSVRRRKA